MPTLYTHVQDKTFYCQNLKPGQKAELLSDSREYICMKDGSLRRTDKAGKKLSKKERRKLRHANKPAQKI